MIKIHAEHLITPMGSSPKKGNEMRKLFETFDTDIIIDKGKILDIKKHKSHDDYTIEAKLVTPALIDAHTHIPFYGKRAREFYLRARGKSYSEIFEQGGGIHNSVKMIRNASIDEIVKQNIDYLKIFKRNGICAIEGKSGYGLEKINELKQLKSITVLNEIQDIKIIPTFLGLHAIPLEENKNEYIKKVESWLEDIKKFTNTIDVFCDKGVFLPDDIKELFESAKNKGFKIRFHADEIENVGATKFAVKIGAVSADHLLKIGDEEIELLSNSNTIATLMPGTSFYLGEPFANARKLIDNGAAIALGSDFNPGSCPIFTPSFIMHLALRFLKMEPEEILTAYTLNSAYVLDIENGKIEPGYKCDIALWNTNEFLDIPYMFDQNFLKGIIINGKVTMYENN
ncbi:imidazolonepropionase [Thermosipho melanesiensis]|uniref:Imidazolonepropionase n=2 Tax=Thermosipho melanesiensis TaxID=46541 RepID=A6LJI4_THEM4|nr:imidazolonepropionase [Thermosipho melanesiensis]ABR30085.1 imidazolonepropionase [Thermosipho melanesiensis BI429]APT73282.1 imidazolonepropionase [Thermosipho melanesiensis]OOC38675.1 imidazolonepropionase [Thermosipho melanesiensis]OOC40479.1 imidazolonepropionase [Thermosipho melanesiensis]OOC40744.1 imidazolonepropionase [Thermosipho melanesiensis]